MLLNIRYFFKNLGCITVGEYLPYCNPSLDQRMDKWFVDPRHIQYGCMLAKDSTYWRDEYDSYQCTHTTNTNIWEIQYGTTEKPPTYSHPAKARFLSISRIWVFRKSSPYREATLQTQAVILEDTITMTSSRKYNLVSDTSSHVKK